MATTDWTQDAGMASDTEVDNIGTFVDQAEAAATASAASASAASASASAAATSASEAAASAASIVPANFLAVANDLSDLNSAATARTNLGLGTAATTASTDYATAAQGALADSALQSSDIGVSVQAYDATIVVDADIGVTVQGYDADTAKYGDATANFTGTLQNGGSNVIVDSDIGSTVQAYDATILVDADIGVNVQAYDANITTASNTQTLTNKTVTDLTFDGSYVEEVFAVTGTTPALDPANGTIQTWTLSGNSTPTDSFGAGESMTLMIDDGTAYTITWPTMQWAGGSAPTLATTGYSVVTLWKVGSTLYGVAAGDMS